MNAIVNFQYSVYILHSSFPDSMDLGIDVDNSDSVVFSEAFTVEFCRIINTASFRINAIENTVS